MCAEFKKIGKVYVWQPRKIKRMCLEAQEDRRPMCGKVKDDSSCAKSSKIDNLYVWGSLGRWTTYLSTDVRR